MNFRLFRRNPMFPGKKMLSIKAFTPAAETERKLYLSISSPRKVKLSTSLPAIHRGFQLRL